MLHSFISQWDVIAAAVWAALFNSLPTVCIVTGCVWLLLERVKGWSAAMRYAGWCGLLALAIGLPMVQWAMPHTSTKSTAATAPLLTLTVPPPIVTVPGAAKMDATKAEPAKMEAVRSAAGAKSSIALADDSGAMVSMVRDQVQAAAIPIPAAQTDLPRATMWGFTAGGGLLLLWALAMMVQLVRLGLALRCNVVLKRSGFAPGETVEARWNELLQRNEDITRPVRLAFSSSLTMPAVVGYRRPVVLLPDTLAAKLSSEELDGILLHELAHVRRRDDWAIAAQRFIQAVFALHPLVHLIASKMELQREIACDDWVLRSQRAGVYASSLTSVAEYCLRPAHSGLMGLAMERPSQLGERVELLLDSTRPVMTRISLRWLGGFASALGLAAVLSLQLPELMAFPVQESAAPVPESRAVTKLVVTPAPVTDPVTVNPRVTVDPRVAVSPHVMKYTPAIPADVVGPITVDPRVVVSPNVTRYIAAVPANAMSPIVVDPQTSTAVGVDADGSTKESTRELTREQAEISRQERELAQKQAALMKQQMELARRKIERSQRQVQQELHEQLEPQMRKLHEQLSHLDTNHLVNDAVRAQIRAGEMEAQIAISQAMSELSRQGLAGKEGRLTPEQMKKLQAERDRYQAQAAQLREQQEKAAKEFSERISAIVNDAVNRALSDTKN